MTGSEFTKSKVVCQGNSGLRLFFMGAKDEMFYLTQMFGSETFINIESYNGKSRHDAGFVVLDGLAYLENALEHGQVFLKLFFQFLLENVLIELQQIDHIGFG